MAACLNHIATFLFLFAVALTPSHLRVHARESKFFSKVTNHISQSSDISIPGAESPLGVPVAAPELSPAPALTPVPAVEESGYHSGSNGVSSVPEMNSAEGTSVDEFEGKISAEELVGETFNMGYNDASLNNFNYDDNVNARSAGGFSSGNVYPTESQQGMSDTRYLENGKYFYDPKGENSYGDAYEPEERTATGNTYSVKGDVYPTKSQQGMSDTRYLENGKYFYHPKGENSYGDAYEPKERTATGNTYNVKENGSETYEFDTMEEYYRKQGIADPQDQLVYVP